MEITALGYIGINSSQLDQWGRGRGVEVGRRPRPRRKAHEDQLVGPGMTERKPPERLGDRPNAGRGLEVDERRELFAEIREDGSPDRRDQVASVGEPLVQGWCADADAIGDRLHRDRVEAAGLEKLAAGGDDVGLGGACPGGTHALSRPIRPRWVSRNEPGSLSP